jgi:alkylation response protein AidB-like acyl-CoA dehydrogenase
LRSGAPGTPGSGHARDTQHPDRGESPSRGSGGGWQLCERGLLDWHRRKEGSTTTGLDVETLDFTLESIGEFARRELPDALLVELDERDEFPEQIVRRMCGEELGIQLLFVPEEYGGMGGNAFDVYRVCERMAVIDLGLATSVLATFLGSDPIAVGGSPDQKQRFMGRIADEGILMAYGATEPDAGSDLAALKTVAKPVSDNGTVVGYRLSGAKQWISNGGVAELSTVLALAPGGPSWFVIDSGADGFTHGAPEDKHGIRLSNTAALFLDEVYVDADRLVGCVEGQGLVQAQQVFGYTRLMVAAFGIGAGWAALDRTILYSRERIQAGGPLSEKAGYTHKLIVPHAVRLEAARAAIEEAAERIDAGEGALNVEGAVAKYLASEAGDAAADAAIQGHGGYGYTHEYMVEKIKRDVRITRIYEGTSEIMEMTIARGRWQEHIKTRGDYYHAAARELEALHGAQPDVGAHAAALAHHALAALLEACRVARLTRHQHILLRLGAIEAGVEGAGTLARRAARAERGELGPKSDRRLDADALATASRINGRDVALHAATEAVRWIAGADGGDLAGLDDLDLQAIHRAQGGLVGDLDHLADRLYGRKRPA